MVHVKNGETIHLIKTNRYNKHVLEAQNESVEMERLTNESYLLYENIGYLQLPNQGLASASGDILEIECGPGVWSREMAKAHRHWRVSAIDDRQRMVTHAQAQARYMRNLRYYSISQINAQLPFPPSSFDLISAQFLSKVLKRDEWPSVLRECSRLLRPNGYIQLTEYEIGFSNSPAHNEFLSLFAQAVALAGGSFSQDGQHLGYSKALPALLQEVGFVQISSVVHQLNYSTGKEEGYKRDFLLVAPNVEQLIVKTGIRTHDELHHLHLLQQQEMQLPSFVASIPAITVWASKRDAGVQN